MEKTKKILIVDDEELVIKALTEKLVAEGFSIDSARDGEEALLKTKQIKPDLILLDIIMPKLDGISVLKRLKLWPETQGIPVIILTNLYDDKKVSDALKTGGTDYLVKVEHSLTDIVKRVKEKLQ
ncbi:MAG: response regulator [Patescibacteria group bacterium]